LTGAEDWEKFAVGVVVLGYAKDRFEFILGFAKGASVNKDYVAVPRPSILAMAATIRS
jgi:hypothetical protein